MRSAVLATAMLLVLTPAMSAKDVVQVVFVVQPDRPDTILKKDAILIAERLEQATSGDSVHVLTTDGKDILSFTMKPGSNPLRRHRALEDAKTQLRDAFLNLIAQRGRARENNVAQALRTVMDRLNFGPRFPVSMIVLMTDGLQRDGIVDWKSHYPSDSWIVHSDSPFSRVRKNGTDGKVYAIMVPTSDAYVDTYHARMIERWYHVFFDQKDGEFAAFTYDHRAVGALLRNGIREESEKPPEPNDMDGPLVLTYVAPPTVEDE